MNARKETQNPQLSTSPSFHLSLFSHVSCTNAESDIFTLKAIYQQQLH